EEVDHLFTMNTNFRSSKSLVTAMNQFFLPQPGFDTFCFDGMEDRIDYQPVEPSPGAEQVRFLRDGNDTAVISVGRFPNQGKIMEQCIRRVYDLLSNPAYSIQEN